MSSSYSVVQLLRLHASHYARIWANALYRLYGRHLAKKLPQYDFEVIALIERLPENAVCIDIGVNEGQLFTFMTRHCYKGTVLGFEPIPPLYRFLSKKFSGKHVQLYPYALSDAEKKVPFYYFDGRSGVSGLSRRKTLLPDTEPLELTIQTKVMDEVLNLSQIDLIKIDVEGAEMNVLLGARQHLLRCNPVVVFECQAQGLNYFNSHPEQVFRFFHELGYGVSLVKYYLKGLPPLDMSTLLQLTHHRYEYQFVAWRYSEAKES